MAIGTHRLEYEVLEGWERLPEGWSFVEVAGVAVDSRDRVYVFNRGAHPVIVFDKDGRFLNAWGEGLVTNAHGIFIDRDDLVYLADNHEHIVRKFTADGKLLMTLGQPGRATDTGFRIGATPVARASGPFNGVTKAAVGPGGEIFVSDGYGNARVHVYSPGGELLRSWGEPGSGEGQFNLPHSIAVDSAGHVYVADRENSRIQIFDSQGNFQREWDWVNRPDDIFIDEQDNLYVAELGWVIQARDVPHYRLMNAPPMGHAPIARVTVCDPDGKIQAQVGGEDPLLPGNFIAPHGIWADSRGDFYVGEVIKTSGAIQQFAPFPCRAFQKFQRSR
jgi:sugar lactone lactonase YvrE